MQSPVSKHKEGKVWPRSVSHSIEGYCCLRPMLTVLNPIVNVTSQALALKHSTMLTKYQTGRVHSFPSRSRNLIVSAPPSPTDSDDERVVTESLRVGIIIHHPDGGSPIRVNTIPSFLEINRRVGAFFPFKFCLLRVS
jgi:hypothetical protein